MASNIEINKMNNSKEVSENSITTPLMQQSKYLSQKRRRGKPLLKYDPFKSPPDFKQAQDHGLARRVCQPTDIESRKRTTQLQDQVSDDEIDQDASGSSSYFSITNLQNLASPQKQNQTISEYQDQSSQIQGFKEPQCPCCGFSIHNRQLSLCVDPKKFAHLGVTYPLYFQFIKKCFLLLLIQMCTSGSNNIILNSTGKACVIQDRDNFICQLSVMNSIQVGEQEILYIQSVGNLLSMIILIVIIEMFKVNQEINRYAMEKHQISPADYTVEIKGYNKNPQLDQVQQLIKDLVNDNNEDIVEICKIYFIFDMQPYSKLYKKKIDLQRAKNKYKSKLRIQQEKLGLFDDHSFEGIKSKIKELDVELLKVDREVNSFETKLQDYTYCKQSLSVVGEENLIAKVEQPIQQSGDVQLTYSGRMLVTLNKSEYAKKVYEQWKYSYKDQFWYFLFRKGLISEKKATLKLQKFMYQGKILKIKRAAEPSDIIWQNIGSKIQKKSRRRWINFMIFMIFASAWAILVGIRRQLKGSEQLYESELWSIGLSFLASTVVALTNTSIGIILRKFAGLETHRCQTDYFVSVGKNLSYLFYMNMVFTTLGSNMLSFGTLQTSTGWYPFQLDGLMYDFFFLFITNTYLSSIFNYFDIMWGLRLLRRRKHLSMGQNSYLSQQEANQLFEGHPADMALRYANVNKLMFFTATVSPLLPIGLIMSLLGLVILYWVDKYLLLRRYVCPHYLDSQLANSMMELLPLYPVFLAFGNILVMFVPVLKNQSIDQFQWPDFYSNKYFYISLVCFFGAISYRSVVKFKFIRSLYFKLFHIRIPKKQVTQTYTDFKQNFRYDYEHYHPVLREYYLPNPEVDEKINEKESNEWLNEIRQQQFN